MARRKLTHGSLFTGVGGIDLGFDKAGIKTLWQCEKDKTCQSVLKRHWPKAKLYDDVETLKGEELEPVDIISFGSPCQDLSIAGKRKGMKVGTRSGLFFEAIRIIEEMREKTNGQYPQYAVWENVKGALTSKEGNDFKKALEELAKIGALDISWRVVSTTHFGPPQRRVRVFLVADFRGQRAGEILSQPSRVLWHPETGDKEESKHTGESGEGIKTDQRRIAEYTIDGLNQVFNENGIYQSLRTWYDGADCIAVRKVANTITSGIYHKSTVVNQDVDRGHLVAYVVEPQYAIRRLTPRECERLQGWPDDHTRWTDKGIEIKDSPRYRMIGNGVSSPVAQWVGENIKKYG